MKLCLIVTVAIFFIDHFIAYICKVSGASMSPTLEDEDKLIVTRIPYLFDEPERFDVIVFEYQGGRDFIKRIIGLPGETVEYKNDELFINGEKIEEPYLVDAIRNSTGTYTEDFSMKEKTFFNTIPPDHYFVLGDNRSHSVDSRDLTIGFIPKDRIKGIALTRFSPLDKLAWNISEVNTTYAKE